MKKNTAIIIPIRMGSTRLPGKFHYNIGNRPMIVHVMEKALMTGIKNVYVAVDDLFHFELIERFGGKAIMTSPNHQSGSDRVFEALGKIDNTKNIECIVNLQGDLPFIDPESILGVVDLVCNGNADIATIAAPITEKKEVNDPNVVKIALGSNNCALYFSRSPIPFGGDKYYHHLGLYAYSRNAIEKFVAAPISYLEKTEKLEQLRAMEIGLKIMVKEVSEVPISVDVKEDLVKAVEHYKKIINTDNYV